jgi:ABC-type branched-subunit amino acid transport system ATPase component
VAAPELLIIDELSLGLAPVILREIQSMIATLAGRGITMLIVEQSLNMAAAIAERSYFMEKGEIRFEGRITDLMERGDLARAVFFGGHDHDDHHDRVRSSATHAARRPTSRQRTVR